MLSAIYDEYFSSHEIAGKVLSSLFYLLTNETIDTNILIGNESTFTPMAILGLGVHMNRIPTIYDVAECAHVSITTVSRFLNDPDKVAPKTRIKIEQSMNDLHFIPKAEAVARARKGTKRIGILSPSLTAQSFVQRFAGVHEILRPREYELVTYGVDSLRQLGGYLSMLPVSGRIDALIVLALPINDKDVERFSLHGIPLVDIEVAHKGVSRIVIDDMYGGELAATYLISKGYKQLGFMGERGEPIYSLHATDLRLKGYKQKLSVLGYPMEEEHICFHEYGMEESIAAAREFLAKPYRPDAVFCASDYQAIGVIKAARSLDIKIPEQLGVLGFDDIDIADYMEISTIRQSLNQSGQLAAYMVIDMLKKGQKEIREIKLELNIVERHTT